MATGNAWTRPAYLEECRALPVDSTGEPLPRAIVESQGVYAIPSRGRLNSPPPHSVYTAFERRRQAQLRFHTTAADSPPPVGSKLIVRTEMNQSHGVTAAMLGGGAPRGYGAERGEPGSGGAGKRGLGPEHYKTFMDSTSTAASLSWDGNKSSNRLELAPGGNVAAIASSASHRGRGPRYAREMLAGTGAAKQTGFYTGVASHYEPESPQASRAGPPTTATGALQAAHKGRGPKYVREALSGTAAATETGFYSGIARFYVAGADSKAGSPDDGPTASPTRNRVSRYVTRELTGSGAARELPGPVVSARTSGLPASGGALTARAAVSFPRDLSVRDAEAVAKGMARSHWETESASMMGGHRAGWRDPVQGAVPLRTGRKPSQQAQYDRFKPTALW